MCTNLIYFTCCINQSRLLKWIPSSSTPLTSKVLPNKLTELIICGQGWRIAFQVQLFQLYVNFLKTSNIIGVLWILAAPRALYKQQWSNWSLTQHPSKANTSKLRSQAIFSTQTESRRNSRRWRLAKLDQFNQGRCGSRNNKQFVQQRVRRAESSYMIEGE